MTRVWRRVKSHIGRRGLVMIVLATMYAVLGLKSIAAPAEEAGRFLLYGYLPPLVRGALWLIPAAIAAVVAIRRTGRDATGFGVLVVPAVVMAFSYAWSTVGYLFGLTDWAYGWASGAIWLLILLLILIVSGWTEVDDPDEDGGDRAE